jgi:hypothetical protein
MPHIPKISVWLIAAVLLISTELFVIAWDRASVGFWEGEALLELASPEIPVSGLPLESASEFDYLDLPERLEGAIEQLSFSDGICGVFTPRGDTGNRGKSLDFFFLEYEAGNPRIITDVFAHAPEVCMRATGAILKVEHPRRNIVVSGEEIEVRVLEFESPGTAIPLWVFRLTWLPQSSPYRQFESSSSLRKEKILSGLRLDAQPPARVLLAGARNYEGLEEAWTSFEALLVRRLSLVVSSS